MVLDDCCISILPFSCREFVFNVYSFDFIFIKVWPFCNYYCLFLGFKILLIFWKFWYIYLYPLSVPRWQKLLKYFTNFALKYLHQLCADGVSPVLHVKKNFAPKIFKVSKRCSLCTVSVSADSVLRQVQDYSPRQKSSLKCTK